MKKLDQDFTDLLDDIEKFQNFEDESQDDGEVNLDLFNKLNTDEIEPGQKVIIEWTNRDYKDHGYILRLPTQDADDEFDYCVHIPKPDNSEGMGDAPEIWIHLYELVKLENVKKVTIKY